jgi:hypothetical protein
VSGANSGPVVSSPSTATVQGTITMPATAQGADYWVALQNADQVNVAWISGSIPGTSTSVDYTMINAPTGSYYVWVLVDVNDDYLFDNGDFTGYYGGTGLYPPIGGPNLVVPSSGTVSDVDVDLTTLNKITISGTITFEDIGVTSAYGGTAAFTAGQWAAFEPYWGEDFYYSGQSTMGYSIDVQAGDALFISAFIDLDGDDEYDPSVDAGGGYPLGVGGAPGFIAYTTDTSGVDFTVYGP